MVVRNLYYLYNIIINPGIMETMTKEQIEQKKQLLKEKLLQMKALYDEIKNSGLMELSEDELNQAVGGTEDSKSWEVFRDAWRMLDDLPAGSTVSISYKEKLL